MSLPEDAWVVGVDNDPVAIELNVRLDERVVGDLAHHTAAPGGLVVLAVPNLISPKSLITKVTPHPFHVWVRRRVLGFPNASLPGFGPYPTTLRRAIAPRALLRRFAGAGFEPVFEAYFEDGKQKSIRRKVAMTGWRWSVAQAVMKGASLGAFDAARSDYVVAFRRR